MEQGVFPAATQESATREAHILLQEALGVSEAVARDLASVQIECPVPGEGRQGSLGEFMASEHGAGKAGQIIETARTEVKTGASPEDAVKRALGFAAVIDKDTGKMARLTAPEQVKKN